jgi:spore germination protein GerM
MKKRRFLAVFLVAMTLIAGGCTAFEQQPKPETTSPKAPPISPKPGEEALNVTLYFGDDQAMYLVPEKREVLTKGLSAPEIVVEELIRGPVDEKLTSVLPKETKLISVSVAEGIAFVNLSKEAQTKHWGGSAGEMMTINSIVLSLTDLEGIKEVQFLIEGEKQEAIWGHTETIEPIKPDKGVIKK